MLAKDLQRSARAEKLPIAARALQRCVKARDEADLRGAYRYALRAKDAAPRCAGVRELLGSLAYDLQKWKEASAELLAFRRMGGGFRRDPEIGACYRMLGRAERAIEFLGEVPQSAGDVVWGKAQIERARAYADLGRVDTARGLIEAAARKAGPRMRGILRVVGEGFAPLE